MGGAKFSQWCLSLCFGALLYAIETYGAPDKFWDDAMADHKASQKKWDEDTKKTRNTFVTFVVLIIVLPIVACCLLIVAIIVIVVLVWYCCVRKKK